MVTRYPTLKCSGFARGSVEQRKNGEPLQILTIPCKSLLFHAIPYKYAYKLILFLHMHYKSLLFLKHPYNSLQILTRCSSLQILAISSKSLLLLTISSNDAILYKSLLFLTNPCDSLQTTYYSFQILTVPANPYYSL